MVLNKLFDGVPILNVPLMMLAQLHGILQVVTFNN